MRMQSTGFSCPSRSISVCSGSARWLWPAAVMTAFLMRKEAPGWANARLAQKTIVALRGFAARRWSFYIHLPGEPVERPRVLHREGPQRIGVEYRERGSIQSQRRADRTHHHQRKSRRFVPLDRRDYRREYAGKRPRLSRTFTE